MGRLELRRFLGWYVKQTPYDNSHRLISHSRLFQHQHMDDFVRKHSRWSFMVAVMDMRLGMNIHPPTISTSADSTTARLLHRSMLRLHDWSNWCHIPHLVSRY
jgi:hypothetical protein